MLLLRWILSTLVLILVAYLTPGVSFASFWSVMVAVLVLGLLNAMIRPVIIALTLPINILTLGLFTFVINGAIFWLASTMVKGFEITNFTAAVVAALIYSLIVALISLGQAPAKPAKSKKKK